MIFTYQGLLASNIHGYVLQLCFSSVLYLKHKAAHVHEIDHLIQNFCFKISGLTQPICTKVTTGVSSVHKLPGHHDCYEFALLPKESLYVPSLLLPKDAVLLYVILTNRQ